MWRSNAVSIEQLLLHRTNPIRPQLRRLQRGLRENARSPFHVERPTRLPSKLANDSSNDDRMTQCNVASFAANPHIYWSYCPSQPAAILFAALYGLVTCVHLVQAIKYRQRNAAIITMGGMLETSAFILRLVSIHQLDLYQVYEAQFIIILIAPLWMNAYDFVLLGRLVNYCMPDKKLCGIPARRIAAMFIASDILTFLIQLAGAAITTSKNIKTVNMGLHLYTAGVVLQQVFILIFLGLSFVFKRRLAHECERVKTKQVKTVLYALYASLALISLRLVFRIVEFSGKSTSKISREISDHEIYLYLFDALPMFLAITIFNGVYPGRYVTGPDAAWPKLTKEQKKIAKEEKIQAKSQKKVTNAVSSESA